MRRVLEALSLFALLSVVILRPLVNESYDSAGSPFADSTGAVSDPSPVRTLLFDGVILLSMLGWLLARATGSPRRYRRTGLEWGGVILVAAAALSCLTAGNQRLALNGSVDWLCYPLLTIALTQLLIHPWHRRLLIAVVLASACVQAAQCFEQYFIGFDETWNHYLTYKQDLWADRGVALDSPKVEAFERRMMAHEATGFFYHSNVAGSYLVMCGLAAVAVTIGRWKRQDRPAAWLVALLTTVAAGLILCATMLTNSRGAWLAGAVGLLVWLLVGRFRAWIATHRRQTVLIAWVIAIVGVVAVAGHGLYHNSLPGWSLTFRWQYWRASADMIADHWATGVGRENFGRHYLQVKPIETPEEVANPHNLFVQAAADWGLAGLVGIVALLVGASLALSRPRSGPPPPTSTSDPPSARTVMAWAAALGGVLVVVRPRLLGTDDPNFVYYATVTATLFWSLGCACFYLQPDHDGSKRESSERLIATGVGAGLLAVLVHDMINFALFVPGTATTFFALLAYGFAGAADDAASRAPASARSKWLPPVIVSTAVVAFAYWMVIPVGGAARHMTLARKSASRLVAAPVTAQVAYRHFEHAAQSDPLDPTPHAELARWLIGVSDVPEFRDDAGRLAEESLARAMALDPFSVQLWRLKMQFHQRIAGATGSRDQYHAAITAALEALKIYPQDPRGLVALADRQLDLGRAMKSAAALQDAINTYREALSLDDARLWWEVLRRFGEKKKEDIEAKMEEARRLIQYESG